MKQCFGFAPVVLSDSVKLVGVLIEHFSFLLNVDYRINDGINCNLSVYSATSLTN